MPGLGSFGRLAGTGGGDVWVTAVIWCTSSIERGDQTGMGRVRSTRLRNGAKRTRKVGGGLWRRDGLRWCVDEAAHAEGLLAEVDEEAEAKAALAQVEEALLDVFRQEDAPGFRFQ